jgi:hypothetical protein
MLMTKTATKKNVLPKILDWPRYKKVSYLELVIVDESNTFCGFIVNKGFSWGMFGAYAATFSDEQVRSWLTCKKAKEQIKMGRRLVLVRCNFEARLEK